MKDGSDKFIKDKVRGYSELDKANNPGAAKSKKRSMTPSSDEMISSYPGTHASEAASPKVVAKDQDLNINVRKDDK